MTNPGNRDILVIGGSAGAVEPLKAILATLPDDLPTAVFVVVHTHPRGTGIRNLVASAGGPMPVMDAADGLEIEPGVVYTAMPDRHLLLSDGIMRHGRGPRENMARPAIDALFRSAAVAYGSRVVGVVLSGLLGDGAAGLHAIKRCGGTTLVQDPDDATADEMPRRALEATIADIVMPSGTMGRVIGDLVRQAPGPMVPVPADVMLEVAIAAGERIDKGRFAALAEAAALTCPSCGGVLSRVRDGFPLRFRCQVGHAFTAEVLATHQEDSIDEAMRVALRIIEERAELVERMAHDSRRIGRQGIEEIYAERAREYRGHAEILRDAVLRSLGFKRDVE